MGYGKYTPPVKFENTLFVARCVRFILQVIYALSNFIILLVKVGKLSESNSICLPSKMIESKLST